MELKLEVIVLPVSDVDRAKDFYQRLDFRLDADFAIDDGYRVVQLTPPGSAASIMIGTGISASPAGSVQGLLVAVPDIEAARADLIARGVDVSELFHEADPFVHADPSHRISGAHPDARHVRNVRVVQRPRRQRLAAAGDLDPAPRALRRDARRHRTKQSTAS